jgi:hypothetical protein
MSPVLHVGCVTQRQTNKLTCDTKADPEVSVVCSSSMKVVPANSYGVLCMSGPPDPIRTVWAWDVRQGGRGKRGGFR